MAKVHLKPPPGAQYRDTVTKQLIDPELGFEADDTDLDVARALAVGDLVPVNPAAGRQKKD